MTNLTEFTNADDADAFILELVWEGGIVNRIEYSDLSDAINAARAQRKKGAEVIGIFDRNRRAVC